MSPAPKGGVGFVARELSPRGHGAVSVVGLHGPTALARARELTVLPELAVGDVRLVRLAVHGGELDRALCVVAAEEDVEFHLHGNPALVAALLEECGGAAPRGESSLEARARRLLEHAPSEAAARILLDQSEGALRREVEALLARDDANRLSALAERSRVARFALEPLRVVLAGPVNAGKSTLFNVLSGERRAIESARAGTTRDVLRAFAQFGAYPVELFDVAGFRPSRTVALADTIEQAGEALARELCLRADWVLWLAPDAARPAPEFAGRATAVLSRADLADPELCAQAELAVSALVDALGAARVVHTTFRARFGLPEQPWDAGLGVAFDVQSRAALERAVLAVDARGRRGALAPVLALG